MSVRIFFVIFSNDVAFSLQLDELLDLVRILYFNSENPENPIFLQKRRIELEDTCTLFENCWMVWFAVEVEFK